MTAFRLADPMRDLRPFLEPDDAVRRLSRGIPCLQDGEWRITHASPDRLEVRDDEVEVVTLSLTLRNALSGRVETRLAFVETAESPGRLGAHRPAAGGPFGALERLGGRDDESGARLWLSPADPRIPHAFDVLDGEIVGTNRCDGAWSLQVLSHRFGRRLCCRLTRDDAQEADLILKVHAGRVDRRPAAFLRRLGPAAGSFRVPRVVHEDPSARFVLLERVPGTSLHERMCCGAPFPTFELGYAIRALQSVPATGLPRHDWNEERATVRKLAARAAVVDPVLAGGVTARLEGILRRMDDAPLVASHRDLHDKQVLCAGEELSLIDWDLVSAAPAPLDPANFLAHLRLRALQGRIPGARARAAREAFVDGYGALPLAWERIALLRLAAVYALRPAWPGLADRLLDAAGDGKETI